MAPSKGRTQISFITVIIMFTMNAKAQTTALWSIGKDDNSGHEFALSPGQYKNYVAAFGGENTVYYSGYSNPAKHWPYVLPGPIDDWAGGGYWSGSHPRHFPRIFFNIGSRPSSGISRLI